MTSNFRHYGIRLLLLATVAGFCATVAASDTDSRLVQLERVSDAYSQALTQLQQQVAANQIDVDSLRGQIQETQYQLSQVIERQKQILLQLDKLSSSPSIEERKTAPATSANAKAEGGKSDDDESAYRAAADMMASALLHDPSRNVEAIASFEAFLKQYPKSKFLPNALYWLGELNNGKGGEKKLALYYFARVAKEYPKSIYASESLYKVGMIMQSKGDKAGAKVIYQQVIRQYPRTEGARQAAKKLKTL